MSTLTYRLAMGDDISFVKKLNEKLLPENYEWHIWRYLQNTSTIYLALDIGRIVGYIAATWGKWPVEGPYVVSIAVLPEYRKQGVGRRLMDYIWEHEKRRGRPLTLHCRASNDVAQSLYTSCGFKEVERLLTQYPLPDGSREDGLMLTRS